MRAFPRTARIAVCRLLLGLASGVVGAQCTNPYQIPNQTISSGVQTFTDQNALKADSVTINNSASVNFIAGNCINLKPGFSAGGTATTPFHAWVQTLPSAVSVAPSSGYGYGPQTFQFKVAHPSGYTNLSEVQALFSPLNAGVSPASGCYIRYNRSANLLYLANDAGTAWSPGIGLGSGVSTSNSRCTISGYPARAGVVGNELTVQVPVTFQTSFTGLKDEYQIGFDTSGFNSGWQKLGSWTVGTSLLYSVTTSVTPSGPPQGGSIGLNPTGGAYASGTQVQMTATPATGYTFTGWSGDVTGTANPLSLTVNTNKTVTASFTTSTATYQHIITSNPLGLTLTVDGVTCITSPTSPCTYNWTANSTHTIAGEFRQQVSGTTHFFSYLGGAGVQQNQASWSSGSLSFPVIAQGSPTTLTAVINPNGLQALRDCLGSSASSNCVLAIGTHTVTASPGTIVINRPNVNIRGEGAGGAPEANRYQTKIVRGSDMKEAMISVDVSTTPSAVGIENLTFCGSNHRVRDIIGGVEHQFGVSPVGCPRSPTTCSQMVYDRTKAIEEGLTPNPADYPCVDFQVAQVQGEWRSDPFASPGIYGLTISSVAFEDSAGHAISLFASREDNKQVNDVYIHDSAINNSAVTGILYGANGVEYDAKFCDGYLDATGVQFRDAGPPAGPQSSRLFASRNIRIENNWFENNNTGAMGGGTMRWVGLRNNHFINNYIYPQVGNGEGGTVQLDGCTEKAEITGNSMVGPSTFADTDALELYGRDFTISGNHISDYGLEAIGAHSLFSSTISGNELQRNGRDSENGGIKVVTSFPGAPCSPIPRDTTGLTITGNYGAQPGGQEYGVFFHDQNTGSRAKLDNVTVGSDSTPYTAWPVYLQRFVGLANYLGGYTLEPADPTAPRVLPVEVTPSPALWPIPPRCSDKRHLPPNTAQGSSRALFRFAASDLDGANNIAVIHGFLSLEGDLNTGSGGPGSAGACRFYYDTASNQVFLDDASLSGAFPWSTPLGGGGSTISNGNCTIRGADSSSPSPSPLVQPVEYVREVKLDIEFPATLDPSPKYRIYGRAENTGGDQSPLEGDPPQIWKYMGYWIGKQ